MPHGAGPDTRRGYRPVADGLARQGVAALIFDKRGSGRSQGVATQSLVAAGVGVTLIPALALPQARDYVAVTPLDDPPSRDVYAVLLTGPPAPAVQAVLDALTAAAGEARDAW